MHDQQLAVNKFNSKIERIEFSRHKKTAKNTPNIIITLSSNKVGFSNGITKKQPTREPSLTKNTPAHTRIVRIQKRSAKLNTHHTYLTTTERLSLK